MVYDDVCRISKTKVGSVLKFVVCCIETSCVISTSVLRLSYGQSIDWIGDESNKFFT